MAQLLVDRKIAQPHETFCFLDAVSVMKNVPFGSNDNGEASS